MSCEWQLSCGHYVWEQAAGKPGVLYSIWSKHSDRQTKSRRRIGSSSKASFWNFRWPSCSYLQILVQLDLLASNPLTYECYNHLILVNIITSRCMPVHRVFTNKEVVSCDRCRYVDGKSQGPTMKMMVPCDGWHRRKRNCDDEIEQSHGLLPKNLIHLPKGE